MGFFSDLKEDLSQAVNELLPEEEQIKADAASETVEAAEADATEAELDVSLEEMLKNIDGVEVPEVEAEAAEEAVTGEVVSTADGEDVDLESMLAQMFAEKDAKDAENAEAANAEAESDVFGAEDAVAMAMAGAAMTGSFAAEDLADVQEAEKGEEKKMDTNMGRVAVDETSVITAGMTITGDLNTEGSIDVIGTVNGNIDAYGKLNITGHINGNSRAAEIYAESAKICGEVVSEGAVKVGASSVIIGNITATSAAIAGAVKGDIDVQGPVILDASAIVMGNIKSKSVQINNGAVIEGMCSQCYADVSPTSFFDDYKAEVPAKGKSK